MTTLSPMTCPKCGAPLPKRSKWSVVDCAFCGVRLSLDGVLVRRADYRAALKSQSEPAGGLKIGAAAFRLLGAPGRTESSDVYLAERLGPLPERVVVWLALGKEQEPWLRREQEMLDTLENLEYGASFFHSLLPQVVCAGAVQNGATDGRFALAFRYPFGFVETLAQLQASFPSGLDARHGVWMLGRLLEMLAWLHGHKYVHGAVLPPNILLNARDHGATLTGWSCAAKIGDRLEAASTAYESFYPKDALAGKPLSPRADLVMAARSIAAALSGGKPELPSGAPKPIAALLQPYLDDDAAAPDSAAEFRENLRAAAQKAFGPPKFVPLTTPAWSRAAG